MSLSTLMYVSRPPTFRLSVNNIISGILSQASVWYKTLNSLPFHLLRPSLTTVVPEVRFDRLRAFFGFRQPLLSPFSAKIDGVRIFFSFLLPLTARSCLPSFLVFLSHSRPLARTWDVAEPTRRWAPRLPDVCAGQLNDASLIPLDRCNPSSGDPSDPRIESSSFCSNYLVILVVSNGPPLLHTTVSPPPPSSRLLGESAVPKLFGLWRHAPSALQQYRGGERGDDPSQRFFKKVYWFDLIFVVCVMSGM